MSLIRIIIFVVAFAASILALENDPATTQKIEETTTELQIPVKLEEKKTELNVSQFTPNYKRSIANYTHNVYEHQYKYNRYEPRNRKTKYRNRKSRQKNKKTEFRLNRFGRGRKGFDTENKTPQLKIKNSKPIININFDSLYKKSTNEDQKTNLSDKRPEHKSSDTNYTKSVSDQNKYELKNTNLKHESQKYDNNNQLSKLDPQQYKPDSKKIDAENKTSVPVHESNRLRNSALEHKKIETESNKFNVEDKTLKTEVQSEPSFNRFEVETKSTEPEYKNSEAKSDFKQTIGSRNSLYKPDLKQVPPENKFNQSELKKIKLEYEKSNLKVKTIDPVTGKTETNYNNSDYDKNNKYDMVNTTSPSVPLKPKPEKENNNLENKKFEFNKQTSTESTKVKLKPKKPKRDYKISEPQNKKAESTSVGDGKFDYTDKHFQSLKKSEPEHKNSDSKYKTIEPKFKHSLPGPKNNEAELTKFDFDSILSELGISNSESNYVNISLHTEPKPELEKLASAEQKIYLLDSRKPEPTAFESRISKEDGFKNKETRSTQITSEPKYQELGYNYKKPIKSVPSKEPKTYENPKIQLEYKIVKEKKATEAGYKISKSDHKENISENKSQSKIRKRIPEPAVRNYKSPKHSKFDANYKIVEVRSSKYEPDVRKAEIEYKTVKPETTQYKPKSPRLQSGQNTPDQDYHEVILEYKKPETKLTKSSPTPIKSKPDYQNVELKFGDSKLDNTKIEPKREHRQSRPEYKEVKPEITISAPASKKSDDKSQKVDSEVQRKDSKHAKSEQNYHEFVIEYSPPEPQNEKAESEDINRNPKYKKSEPKKERPRHKNSQFANTAPKDRENDPHDKVISKYESPKFEQNYRNHRHGTGNPKTASQESKIKYKDRLPLTTKLISEHTDLKHESTYKELKPGYRKVLREYEKSNKLFDTKYKEFKSDVKTPEPEYRNLKSKYPKYRPEIRKTNSDSNRSRPVYRFPNREPKEKRFVNVVEEHKTIVVKPKYSRSMKNDEPERNESKTEYKTSETKDRNFEIVPKNSEAKHSDASIKNAEPEKRKSTTERYELEIKTSPEDTALEPGQNGGNTTQKENFFYKVIKDWW